MELQEIDMKGKLWTERVSAKPNWKSKDESRLIYAEDSHKLWIGTNVGWEIFDSNIEMSIQQRLVNIGNWDMDTTASVSVTHGLSLGNIVGVRAIIINDEETYLYPFSQLYRLSAPNQGGILSLGVADVSLYRKSGGFFDSADFNTSMNRGYVVFDYWPS